MDKFCSSFERSICARIGRDFNFASGIVGYFFTNIDFPLVTICLVMFYFDNREKSMVIDG